MHAHVLIDNLSVGGAELLVAEFAGVARQAGIELTVATLRDASTFEGSLPPDARFAAGERLRRQGIEPAVVPITSLLNPSDLRRVRRHLASVAPDVLHTHLGASDTVGGLAARSLGIPSVSTIHRDQPLYNRRSRARSVLTDFVRRHTARRVIVVSEAARAAYLARAGRRQDRVVTVHNGITTSPEPGAGGAVRAELGLGPDQTVVTMLAQMRPEKRFDVAVEAVAALRESFPDLRFLIVGEGALRGDVERLAAPLADTALVLGHRTDPMAVFDATDVVLYPTDADAFPTSLLEAMIAGVPVVASAVGGIPEIIEHERTGLLVPPPPRASDFVGPLARLVGDPGLRTRFGSAGVERFQREFSGERWAAQIRDVYDAVLREAGRRPANRRPLASAR